MLIFSSSYTNYKIIIDQLDSATADRDVSLRLRADTTDLTSAVYEHDRLTVNGTTITGARVFSGTSMEIGDSTTTGANYKSTIILDLTRPFEAKFKTVISHNFYPQTGQGPTLQIYGGDIASAVSYNGFTILASSNISGTISIYGYNK